MWYVYIIKSETTGEYYVGLTSNFSQRLQHHNSGANRSTRHKGPWILIYNESYNSKLEAWERERQIKSYKGGNAFKKLLTIAGEVA